MAEDGIAGKPFPQDSIEGIYVVDPLACINTLTKEILVDIGYSSCIRVNAAVTGENSGKEAAGGGGCHDVDPRL